MKFWLNPSRWWFALCFFCFYVWEVAISSVRVACDVMAPTPKLEPAFITVHLQHQWSDFGLLILGNLISMTPGTLTVDVGEDRRTLDLHVLYAGQPDKIRDEVIPDFERRLARVLA